MKFGGERRQSRRAFDWRILRQIQNAHVSVLPFATAPDALGHRVLDARLADAGHALVVVATYNFPMLLPGGGALHEALVLFDASDLFYPYTQPRVQVISHPRPWSSHIESVTGSVCVGSIWSDATGQMLLAELVIHIMRVLNFDEKDPNELGYNPVARQYWIDVLGRQPITPGLAYPTLPEDLAYGLAPAEAMFRARTTPGFRRLP